MTCPAGEKLIPYSIRHWRLYYVSIKWRSSGAADLIQPLLMYKQLLL